MQFTGMKYAHKMKKTLHCLDASVILIHYYQDVSFFICYILLSIQVSGHLQCCSSINASMRDLSCLPKSKHIPLSVRSISLLHRQNHILSHSIGITAEWGEAGPNSKKTTTTKQPKRVILMLKI